MPGLLLFHLAFLSPLLNEAPLHVTSWKSLAQALARSDATLDEQELTHLPEIQQLSQHASWGFLSEMASQREYPQVTLTAFYLIKQKHPRRLTEVAFRIAMHSPNPASPLLEPVYRWLESRSKTHPEEINQLLSKRLSSGEFARSQIDALIVMLQVLSPACLHDWFNQNRNAEDISVAAKALVLDTLMGAVPQKVPARTSAMNETLRTFASIPGTPREVYCLWAEDEDDTLRRCIRSVLEDPDTAPVTVAVLVRRRLTVIQQLDLRSLNLRDEVRGIIDRAMKKAGKP